MGRQQILSRDRVVREALAYLDETGLRSVTMRGLGQRLGVEAMSLYRHVPNKTAMLQAVLDHALHEPGLIHVQGGSPRERVENTISAYRGLILQHPALLDVIWELREVPETAWQATGELHQTLQEGGLSADAAWRGVIVLSGFTNGFLQYETVMRSTPPNNDLFPSFGRVLTPAELTMEFDWGLSRLLDGLLQPVDGAPSGSVDGARRAQRRTAHKA